jgi:hypothetical protein
VIGVIVGQPGAVENPLRASWSGSRQP